MPETVRFMSKTVRFKAKTVRFKGKTERFVTCQNPLRKRRASLDIYETGRPLTQAVLTYLTRLVLLFKKSIRTNWVRLLGFAK